MNRVRKRDGTVFWGFRNPAGSWVEVPLPDDATEVTTLPSAVTASHATSQGSVREFLQKIGQRGGQARAARHSRTEIAAWGAIRHKAKSGA